MGFIFWPKSSRYVSQCPDYLPKRVKRVGVFVDEDPEQVKRLADDYGLDYIQLHGHETPEVISYLRPPALPHPRIIKAFNISTAEDLIQTQPYEGLVDYFLFDAKGKSVGGNGEKFNWDVLDAYQGNTPFLLSGGIGPDDAERGSVVASVQTTQSGLMPFIILSASASISTPASNSPQASKMLMPSAVLLMISIVNCK